jgi:hypothetical protein
MQGISLERLRSAIRASWTVETCDPVDVDDWSPGNPSRGQCGATALVVNDILGGNLLVAEVLLPNGSRQGFHYWNRLPEGDELDLTRDQFSPEEIVQAPDELTRPDGPPRRCLDQYLLLRDRVLKVLGESG